MGRGGMTRGGPGAQEGAVHEEESHEEVRLQETSKKWCQTVLPFECEQLDELHTAPGRSGLPVTHV